jgi:hypothetical protein
MVTVLGSAPSDGAQYSTAALSPDGSRAVSNGVPPAAWPPQLPHGLHIDSGTAGASTLIDTATGAKPDEPRLTAIDCCDPNNLCLAGRCAEQTPTP